MAIGIRSIDLTNYSHQLYHVDFFGDTVTTLVTGTACIVDRWIDEIKNLQEHRPVVGLDVEWRPITYRGAAPNSNKVATLQLCVNRNCLIFQLNRADEIPQSLMKFLADQNYTFVGVGIDDDAAKLYAHYGLGVSNSMDLRELAVSRYEHGSYRNSGLKKLTRKVLGKDFEKPRRVTMSDWDVHWLSLEQIEYACVDAYVSFEIGRVLLAAMTKTSTIADSTKTVKLNGENYKIWSRRAMYYLLETNLSKHIDFVQEEVKKPEVGESDEVVEAYRTYQKWLISDRKACSNLLCLMEDDLMGEFETAETAKEMWDSIKQKYGSTSAIKLRFLILKFDPYHKKPGHSMAQHLRVMSFMIRELETAGHKLSNESQVQAVLRSLPRSWDDMKLLMTHNENVTTFDDIKRHLLLEVVRIEATKSVSQAMSPNAPRPPEIRSRGKANKSGNVKGNVDHGPKGKIGKRYNGKRVQKQKNMNNIMCYNCQKTGHLARGCTEPKTQRRATI